MSAVPRRLALLLFLASLQTFAYFVPGATWNPMSRFAATHALVEHGTLELGVFAASTGDRARRDGRWYSDKAPLPALAGVPAYALVRAAHAALGRPAPSFVAQDEDGIVARHLVVSKELSQLLYVVSIATAGASGALLVLLVLRLCARRASPGRAVAATVAAVFCTPIFPYATSYYGHVPAALCLVAALVALDRERPTERHHALVGLALGTAVGCEYLSAIPGVVVGLGALAIGRATALRTLAALCLGALLPVATIATVHAICFGGPLRTGYSFLVDPTFVRGHETGFLGIALPDLEGLWGLLAGARRGLFRVAPVSFVAVVGLVLASMRGDGDRIRRIAAIAFVAMLCANAGYYMWWGGAATGPRHLVPVMPVLAFGLLEVLRHRAGRVAVAVVGFASAAQMLAFVSVGLEAPESGDAVVGYAWPQLAAGHVAVLRGASNLGLRLGLPNVASLGPLLVFVILVGRALVVQTAEIDPDKDDDPSTDDVDPIGDVSRS